MSRWRPRLRPSFPRARGDGPEVSILIDGRPVLPPRPRGWTCSYSMLPLFAQASPAPAGMDPVCFQPIIHEMGFPRARGDGPSRTTSCSPRRLLPPRPRGWTLAIAM